MKIVFVVLAHQKPELVNRLLKRILVDDDFFVVLHYDLKAPTLEFDFLKQTFAEFRDRLRFAKRVDIQWGEWSMVEAILGCLSIAMDSKWDFDYVYLMSAADYPIKPLSQLKSYLKKNNGKEFIESFDAERQKWVAGGIQKERYEYWHFFNWRRNPRIFSLSLFVQKLLFIKRKLPEGHKPFIGSQWWTLTRKTCKKMLDFSKNDKIIKFYKRVWVPDELYFQTLIRSFVENSNIVTHSLTFYEFSDYGVPVVYCNGHEQHILKQGFFFARKISNYAHDLRNSLDQVICEKIDSIISDDNTFGNKKSNYQEVRLAGRYGAYGKRKIGYVEDVWYGDLEWNTLPYFVICGMSDRLMRFFQEMFMHFNDVVCHGYLFDEKKIDFCFKQDGLAGYKKNNLQLRNHNELTFLSDLIHFNPNKVTGYLLNANISDSILDVHIWDPRAIVFVLQESPTLSFFENHFHNMDCKFADTLYAQHCQKLVVKHQAIKDKLVSSGKIGVSGFSIKYEDFFDPKKKTDLINMISIAIRRNYDKQVLNTFLRNHELNDAKIDQNSNAFAQITETIIKTHNMFLNRTKKYL